MSSVLSALLWHASALLRHSSALVLSAMSPPRAKKTQSAKRQTFLRRTRDTSLDHAGPARTVEQRSVLGPRCRTSDMRQNDRLCLFYLSNWNALGYVARL